MTAVRYYQPSMKRRILAGDIPDWLLAHPRKGYIIQATLSFPDWVPIDEVKRLYKEAERLTRMTGIPHVVDHIIPLTHPKVSGLSVPWNLRVTTQLENARKGNKWDEQEFEQLCLFERQGVEQYQLPL